MALCLRRGKRAETVDAAADADMYHVRQRASRAEQGFRGYTHIRNHRPEPGAASICLFRARGGGSSGFSAKRHCSEVPARGEHDEIFMPEIAR